MPSLSLKIAAVQLLWCSVKIVFVVLICLLFSCSCFFTPPYFVVVVFGLSRTASCSLTAQGNVRGSFGVGVSYEYGLGTAQDYARAAEEYRRGSEGNNGGGTSYYKKKEYTSY